MKILQPEAGIDVLLGEKAPRERARSRWKQRFFLFFFFFNPECDKQSEARPLVFHCMRRGARLAFVDDTLNTLRVGQRVVNHRETSSSSSAPNHSDLKFRFKSLSPPAALRYSRCPSNPQDNSSHIRCPPPSPPPPVSSQFLCYHSKCSSVVLSLGSS